MQPTVQQLRKVHVLASLHSSDLARLQSAAEIVAYPPSARIFIEGEDLRLCLYALIEGRIQVSRVASTGKETILRVLPAGEIFAAPALLGNGIAPATVIVLTNCQVVMIEREALLETFRRNPETALRMMMVLNQRLQHLHDQVHGLVSERAVVRLAQLIQYTAAEHKREDGVLKTNLPYYQIARSIGITYEECVRLFKQLQSVLHYRRGGKIQVLDWDELDAIASGDID